MKERKRGNCGDWKEEEVFGNGKMCKKIGKRLGVEIFMGEWEEGEETVHYQKWWVNDGEDRGKLEVVGDKKRKNRD
jgi:hypothetical protein